MRATKILIMGLALSAGLLRGGTSLWVSGRILSPAIVGTGMDASMFAGVTLLREQIPGEMATQLASSDTLFPTRVMFRPNQGAYFLTDVGSQWPSAVASGQVIVAIAEVFSGQHAWQGKAFASASFGSVIKPDLIQGLVNLASQELVQIPEPIFESADTSQIALRLSSFKDLSGLARDFALWRRLAGSSAWDFVSDTPIPSVGTETVFVDTTVQGSQIYEYGLSVNYLWKGGGGQGRRGQISGIYSTEAMSLSSVIAADTVQPTPTSIIPTAGPSSTPIPMPDGWIAYPNPVLGSKFWITIELENTGILSILAYTVDGTLALTNNTQIEQTGRNKIMIEVPKLASGIYLLKAKLRSQTGDETIYPLRKLAIVK